MRPLMHSSTSPSQNGWFPSSQREFSPIRLTAERAGSLGRLGSYVPAVQGLAALPDLPSYLRARGRRPSGSDPRSLADAALQAFVAAVWQDATDFAYDHDRFAAAYAERFGERPSDTLRASSGR